MALLSSEGYIEAANPFLCEFLGYAASELKGKHFREITVGQDREADTLEFERMIEGEQDSYSMTKLYKTKFERVRAGRLRVQRLPTGEMLVFAQVLPLDVFEAADVPADQRAKVVSLAIVDLVTLAFKNWKVVAIIVGILMGTKIEALIELLKSTQ